MRSYLLYTALLLSLISGPAWPAAAPRILIIGDSISAAYGIDHKLGWVNLLQQRLSEKGYPHIIVNASVSGDTTLNGLTRLPLLLERYRPTIVIIELGGNDGLRGLPLSEMQDNLEQMIQVSLDHGSRVVLTGIRLPPNYGPDFNRRFAAIYQHLAQRYGLAFQPRLLQDIAEPPRTDAGRRHPSTGQWADGHP